MSLKKQITISPDLLKGGGNSLLKKEKKENKKPKIKMNKPSKLKKEFLKRIKNHRENLSKNNDENDVAFSSDFQESMKYLMDVMKNNNNNNNKTLKKRPIPKKISNNVPEVNISLPTELTSTSNLPIVQTNSIQPIDTIPMSNITPINIISTNNQVKNKNNLPNNIPSQSIPKIKEEIIKTEILPDLPYGALKNGNKPTYRMWLNKTQKNRENTIEKKNIENDNIENKEKHNLQEKLNHLKNKYGVFSKPNLNLDKNKSYKKKKYSTIKRKYILGQNKTKRKIAVLIKNSDLRARVQVERSMLRAKPLHIMKNHLYSHGILKVGNNAPKDLIKKIYEDSILTGDVNNISKEVLIYNYLNKKDE